MLKDNKKNILVVDHDENARPQLIQFLERYNYRVMTAQTSEEIFALVEEQIIDLVILDISLPNEDGFDVCKELRQRSNVLIIIVTKLADEADSILGLEIGADNYIIKPCRWREVLARVKALLRRRDLDLKEFTAQQASSTHQQEIVSTFKFNDWILDTVTRILLSPEKQEIHLSAGCYELLLAFLKHPQQVLSRDELLDITQGRSANAFDRSIDIRISRLRQKIETVPQNPRFIKTVRAGGYIFSAEVTH